VAPLPWDGLVATPWRILLAAGTISAGSLAVPAHAGDGSWAWPLDHPSALSSAFDAPDTPYARGHRGVDLPGTLGAEVRAVAPGVVSFAGQVAGLGVVTVEHGTERSTYQPVEAAVEVGQEVDTGDVIGTLLDRGSHCATPCLHLGRLADESYLDPADRLAMESTIRLFDPDGPVPVPPTGPTGSGVLRRPVGGPVTSVFGPRTHPITGKRSFHDGVDFASACGTEVHPASSGTVRAVSRSGAYGRRVVLQHGPGMTTSYSHLSRTSVRPGDTVSPDATIGTVGSTGLSTGCHLHFGVSVDGNANDPLLLL
jgi:murein DD-endopeptidase MepM/ murein hydrolase activator NlpD